MAIKLINPLGRDPSIAMDHPSTDVILLNILTELRVMNEFLSGRADPNDTTDAVRSHIMTEVL